MYPYRIEGLKLVLANPSAYRFRMKFCEITPIRNMFARSLSFPDSKQRRTLEHLLSYGPYADNNHVLPASDGAVA